MKALRQAFSEYEGRLIIDAISHAGDDALRLALIEADESGTTELDVIRSAVAGGILVNIVKIFVNDFYEHDPTAASESEIRERAEDNLKPCLFCGNNTEPK